MLLKASGNLESEKLITAVLEKHFAKCFQTNISNKHSNEDKICFIGFYKIYFIGLAPGSQTFKNFTRIIQHQRNKVGKRLVFNKATVC